MDIKQLRAFLAVANARSFLGAAEKLYISRQAVSKTVSQLEEELNIELFVRDQSGALMTPAGIYFYPRAVALVSDFDKLQAEMRDIDSAYRPMLNIFLALGLYSLYADRLTEYGIRHRAEMDIRVDGCLDADCETILTDRRADAVLSFTPLSGRMGESVVLSESPLFLLLPPEDPLTQGMPPDVNALSAQCLLLYTGGRERCPWWPDKPRSQDVKSCDLGYLFGLLREGRGIMPLPKPMVPTRETYFTALPCAGAEPCRLYYSTLAASYYNTLTYNLLASVRKDVFST